MQTDSKKLHHIEEAQNIIGELIDHFKTQKDGSRVEQMKRIREIVQEQHLVEQRMHAELDLSWRKNRFTPLVAVAKEKVQKKKQRKPKEVKWEVNGQDLNSKKRKRTATNE